VNHNGELPLAKQLIEVASRAKADAVKFQSFKADRLAASHAPKARYQVETTGSGESQRDMLRRLELSAAAHRELADYCRRCGVLFLSTPFDEERADLLVDLDVAALKISSGDLTNLPFLRHVARKGRPMIVSTGMSTLSEVAEAMRAIQTLSDRGVALLHCVSQYPADPSEANLRAMETMAMTFNVPVGYSDHTLGIEVALAAVALGGCILEKHVTLDRHLPGPDHRASLEPDELVALVRGIRTVESALGHGRKEPAAGEAETAAVARKSLVAARHIPAGSLLTEALIAMKRPGIGLPPTMLPQLVGRTVVRDIPADTLLTLEMVA
jgi:N-acetylneuraminate synthase